MGLKRFSIYSLIITSLVVIFCVICCFVVIPTPFTFTEMPSKIVVYNYKISSKGETLTSTNSQKENYQIIYDEFVKSSNLSMFQRIVSGANIFEKPTHDVKGIKPTWPTVKGNNATIELTFTNKQHMIVSVDGNTKRIDFYEIAMIVSSSPFVYEVSLYYKSNKNADSYTSTPIIMKVETKKLYKLITGIIKATN